MKNSQTVSGRILSSPLLWGGGVSLVFYLAIHQGIISNSLVVRYFAGHPINYVSMVMFCVGIAAMGLKYVHIRRQHRLLQSGEILEPRTAQRADVKNADRFLTDLARYEKENGPSLLTRRLKQALLFVRRSGSADELDTELRYLSDEEATKCDADYALVRLILWAVPMVGFLGTVVGITMALGNLDLNAINESSKMLSAGLSVAFDTTAQAIALDLILYYIQFLVYRKESQLLWEIDRRTDNELRGRFEWGLSSTDNTQVVALRRMFETVSESLEQLMARQSKIWEQSMHMANQRFTQVTESSAEVLKSTLSSALNENLDRHAQSLVRSESQLMDKARESTLQWNESLRQNAADLRALQEETIRQTEAIRKVLGTCGQLAKLEERLNQNLAALAQAGNFEETVNSLAATIHLLNGRNLRRVGNADDEKGSAA